MRIISAMFMSLLRPMCPRVLTTMNTSLAAVHIITLHAGVAFKQFHPVLGT